MLSRPVRHCCNYIWLALLLPLGDGASQKGSKLLIGFLINSFQDLKKEFFSELLNIFAHARVENTGSTSLLCTCRLTPRRYQLYPYFLKPCLIDWMRIQAILIMTRYSPFDLCMASCFYWNKYFCFWPVFDTC